MTESQLDELDLSILGIVIDSIEKQSTREQKIAALRCFVRGLKGKLPLEGDREIMEIGAGSR